MSKTLKNDRYLLAIAWIILGALGRLLPHPPNVTPMTSIALFGGSQLGRALGFAVVMISMILGDIGLAYLMGYQAFGAWSLFTYTGFAAIILAGSWLRSTPSALRTLGFLLGSSLGFWLWTNFGLWAVGGEGALYPRTMEGLVACYVAALPFLRNALAGDLIWGAALFLSFHGVRRLAPRFGWSVQGA